LISPGSRAKAGVRLPGLSPISPGSRGYLYAWGFRAGALRPGSSR
jgi:hypothetical protein